MRLREGENLFEEELKKIGLRAGFKKIFLTLAAASFVAALLELIFVKTSFVYLALLFFSTLVFPSLLLFFYLDYLREKKRREIEAALPAALLQAASFPKRASIEEIISSISRAGYGALSQEFARAEKQIQAGASVDDALARIAGRNDSLLLNHAVSLLVDAYKSGADLTNAFREVAEDVFELQALVKENASAMTLQKYTLLFGGGAIVPLVLGLLLNVVSSLDIVGVKELFGSAAGVASRKALTETILLGNQVYLAVFAGVASIFVASAEASPRKAILYFAFLLPLSLAVFLLARSITII